MAQISDVPSPVLNEYSYNGNNQLDTLVQTGQDGGNAVADKMVDFTYTTDGQFETISRYADLEGEDLVATSTYSYDTLGRVTEIKYTNGDTTYANYNWTYNADNEVTSFSDGIAAEDTSYGYDAAGQLTSATPLDEGAPSTPENSLGNSYDPNGNADTSGGAWSPSLSECVDIYGGTDYGAYYSTDGGIIGLGNRELSDGTYDYAYDADGNLISQTAIDPGDVSGPAVIDYSYDNRNRLASVTDKNADGDALQVVNYTYDVYNELIGEALVIYDTSGDVLATRSEAFVYDGDNSMILAFGMGVGTTDTGFGGSIGGYTQFGGPTGAIGSPPSSSEWTLSDRYLWVPGTNQILVDEDASGNATGPAGTLLWGLTDNQYTVHGILESDLIDGSCYLYILDHISYTPFGAPVSHDGLAAFLFEYQGEMYDQNTALQYNFERWYSSNLERWLSEDPLFPESGPNPYEALDNSPTNFTDPSGLTPMGVNAGGQTYSYDNPNPVASEILQRTVDQVNQGFADDISAAAEFLAPGEQMAAASDPYGIGNAAYGNAVEGGVFQAIGNDPDGLGALFDPVGGKNSPDLIGKGPFEGEKFEITTPRGVASHLDRDYGDDLNFATYERPPGFPFPKAESPENTANNFLGEVAYGGVLGEGGLGGALAFANVYVVLRQAGQDAGMLKPDYYEATHFTYRYSDGSGSTFEVFPSGLFSSAYRNYVSGPRAGETEDITDADVAYYEALGEAQWGRYNPGSLFSDPTFTPGYDRDTLPITNQYGQPRGYIDESGIHTYTPPILGVPNSDGPSWADYYGA